MADDNYVVFYFNLSMRTCLALYLDVIISKCIRKSILTHLLLLRILIPDRGIITEFASKILGV